MSSDGVGRMSSIPAVVIGLSKFGVGSMCVVYLLVLMPFVCGCTIFSEEATLTN